MDRRNQLAWASVALVAVASVTVLCSDLFIRARGLDGKFGLNAHSYDIVATALLLLGMFGFYVAARTHQRNSDPMVTRTIRIGGPDPTLLDEVIDTIDLLAVGTMGTLHFSAVKDAEDEKWLIITGRQTLVDDLIERLIKHLETNQWMRVA